MGRLAAAVLLLLVLPAGLSAQADRWERQVLEGLSRAQNMLADRGYRPEGSPATGVLPDQERAVVKFRLSAGRAYAVVGVCDADCGTLQLVLAREGGYEIAADRGPGNVPIVRVTPERSGGYQVRVLMAACRESPCRFGLRLLSRPAG